MMEKIKETGIITEMKQTSSRDIILTIRIECPSVDFEHKIHFGDEVTIEQGVK